MGNRSGESNSSGTATAYNTVFIDTNLETHLAMIVSNTDTVSDLKNKIILEHPQCFPKIGEIKIQALKVKRRGYFYHLSDSMLVRSAFEGAKRNWFLSVDASSLKEHCENDHSCKPDVSNKLALVCVNPLDDKQNCFLDDPLRRLSIIHESSLLHPTDIQCADQNVPNTNQSTPMDSAREVSKNMEMEVKYISDGHWKTFSSDAHGRSDLEIQEKDDVISGANKLPRTTDEHKYDSSSDGIGNVHCNIPLEQSFKTKPAVKKNKKIKKQKEDMVCEHNSKDSNDSVCVSRKDASRAEFVGPESSLVDAGGEVSNDMKMGKKDVCEEPCKTSSLDINKTSDTRLHRKYNLHQEPAEIPEINVECKNDKSENMIDDLQCNHSFEDVLKVGPSVKKKHKIQSKENSGNPLEEEKELISKSSEETSKLENKISENPAQGKQKNRNAASDLSLTEPPGENHLGTSSNSGKRKRKWKKASEPYNQVALASPSSAQEVVEERSSKKHVQINNKNLVMISDAASVPGQGVQLETLPEPSGISQKEKPSEPVPKLIEGNKASSSTTGTYLCDPESGNVKGNSDAPDLASGAKGTKYSKKHFSTNVKKFSTLVLKESHKMNTDVGQSVHQIIVSDDHEFEAFQTDKTEEARELSQNHDPEVILSEKCKPLHQDEADMDVKEHLLTSKVLEADRDMESGKSGGTRTKKRRAKKSAARKEDASDTEHANNAVTGTLPPPPPNSGLNDHSHEEVKKDESILSHSERKEVLKQKSVDSSFAGADRGGDNLNGNEAESLLLTQVNRTPESTGNVGEKSRKKVKKNRTSSAKHLPDSTIKQQGDEMECLLLNQINQTQGIAENMDEKVKKKIKKNQNSAAKSHSVLPVKDQEVNAKDLTASNDKMGELNAQARTTKKTRLAKTSDANQLTGSEFELGKNSGTECGSSHPEQKSKNVESSQVPSSCTIEYASNGRPDTKGDVGDHLEVSVCDGDGINFKQYFVPGTPQDEVTPADKVKEAMISDREMKGKKKRKKLVAPYLGSSPDLENSLKSFGHQNINSSGIQESVSKDEDNDVTLHSCKKSSKVSGDGAEAPHSHEVDGTGTPQEASQPDSVIGSGANRPAHVYPKGNGVSSAASSLSSSSESSGRSIQNSKNQSSLDRYHVAVRKPSSKNTRKVMNSSQREKSLLTTPGAIFRDASSQSSGDENRTLNSDTSTRTPSDDSSSSGYSGGGSKLTLNSARNGSYSMKRKEGVGKDIIKSHSSGLKNITMDMILRSSSRYKKAKLTASQSQLEDTESQPVDFVPDSQANL